MTVCVQLCTCIVWLGVAIGYICESAAHASSSGQYGQLDHTGYVYIVYNNNNNRL